MSNAFDQFDAPAKAGNPFDQFDAPAATPTAPPKAGFTRKIADVGLAVGSGVMGVAGTLGDAYGLVTGDMDNSLSDGANIAQDWLHDKQSEGLKYRRAQRSAAIDRSEGVLAKAGTAIAETVTDPGLLVDTLAENAATMLPALGVGSLASKAMKARALARGATAADAGSVGASAGVKAAVGTAAAQQGADVSASQYEQALREGKFENHPDFQARVAAGESPEQVKHDMALASARATFLPAAAISVGSQLIPGGATIERAVLGDLVGKSGIAGRVVSAVKGALGEGGQEAIEEGGGQFAGNLAQREFVDPGTDLTTGVGEAAGLGAIGGAGLGAVGGAFHRTPAATQPGQPQPGVTPPPQPSATTGPAPTAASAPAATTAPASIPEPTGPLTRALNTAPPLGIVMVPPTSTPSETIAGPSGLSLVRPPTPNYGGVVQGSVARAAAAAPVVPENEQAVAFGASDQLTKPAGTPESGTPPTNMDRATGEIPAPDEDQVKSYIWQMLDQGNPPNNKTVGAAFGITPERAKQLRAEVQADRKAAALAKKNQPERIDDTAETQRPAVESVRAGSEPGTAAPLPAADVLAPATAGAAADAQPAQEVAPADELFSAAGVTHAEPSGPAKAGPSTPETTGAEPPAPAEAPAGPADAPGGVAADLQPAAAAPLAQPDPAGSPDRNTASSSSVDDTATSSQVVSAAPTGTTSAAIPAASTESSDESKSEQVSTGQQAAGEGPTEPAVPASGAAQGLIPTAVTNGTKARAKHVLAAFNDHPEKGLSVLTADEVRAVAKAIGRTFAKTASTGKIIEKLTAGARSDVQKQLRPHVEKLLQPSDGGLFVRMRDRVEAVESFADASAKFLKFRAVGDSVPLVELVDAQGAVVGHLSHDGKVYADTPKARAQAMETGGDTALLYQPPVAAIEAFPVGSTVRGKDGDGRVRVGVVEHVTDAKGHPPSRFVRWTDDKPGSKGAAMMVDELSPSKPPKAPKSPDAAPSDSERPKVRVKKGRAEYVPQARESLQAYFKPGRIVASYGGYDKVLGFDWNDGAWSVRVIASDKDGNSEAGARERQHSTLPDPKHLVAVFGRAQVPEKAPKPAKVAPAAKPKNPIAAAGLDAATSPKNDLPAPTEAQIEAGNYAKGHIWINGLDVSIENPAGSKRRPEWPTLKYAYGYLKRTEGADGEHIDVFVSTKAMDADLPVFVIDQNNRDGSFDEHKVMLGFADEEAARAGYLANYTKGWTGLGAITQFPLADFKAWLREGDTTKPAAPPAETEPPSSGTKGPVSDPKAARGESIEDFGETLHGARKHYAAAYADRMATAEEVDVAAEPLSKSWPAPDYAKLIEGGAEPFTVAWVHAARDEIPTKPKKGWKLGGWVDQVKLLRDVSNKMLRGEITADAIKAALTGPAFLRTLAGVAGRAELYQAVGHDVDLKGVRMGEHHYSLYKGEKNVTKWSIEKKAKATMFSNWPTELGVGNTKEEAIAAFRSSLAELSAAEKSKSEPSTPHLFIIYSRRLQEGFFIGRKVGKETIDLKRFASVKEAREFKTENFAELESLWAKFKDVPAERRATNLPRVGVDHRSGGDVSPDQFSETFAFRGVQFGNYVEGDRRQQDLNNAYDALLDLAGIIGVDPKALSLNGTLGLAFGARGHGGKNPAAAHFESGTVVINLTKNAGAGSLAHEWFHGLDNYFSRQRGEKGGFLTETGDRATPEGVRAEMRRAFNRVMSAIQGTGVKERSKELDKRRAKAYWATGLEMAARSFESYVIAKLADQNASNDYLANIVSDASFGIEGGYPYPTAAEIPAIRAGFDEFFQTIESEPGDKGSVRLYSQPDTAGTTKLSDADVLRAIAPMRATLGENAPKVQVVSLPEFLPKSATGPGRFTAEGFYDDATGTVYLVTSNLSSPARARQVFVHETVGHHGIEAITGPALWQELTDAVEKMRMSGKHAELFAEIDRRYRDESGAALAPGEPGAVRETIAVLAEKGVRNSVVDRVMAAMRRFLRKLGFTVSFSEAELRQHVVAASRHVRQGGGAAPAGVPVLQPLFSRLASSGRPLSDAFQALAKLDGAFRYETSTKTDLAGVFADIAGDEMKVQYKGTASVSLHRQDGTTAQADRYHIETKNGQLATVYIGQGREDRMYVDASSLDPGKSKGALLYMALFQFAKNAGKVFVGDPNGLSDDALLRRTEMMAAAALKYGGTEFMFPHRRQLVQDVRWADRVVWGDDSAANLESLLSAAYNNALRFAPGIADVTYDFDRNEFLDAGGQPVTRYQLERIAAGARKAFAARNGSRADADGSGESAFGRTTITRAIFANSFLRATGSQQSEVVGGNSLGRGSASGRVPDALAGALYSQPDTAPAGVLEISPDAKLSIKAKLAGKLTDLKPLLLGAIPMNYLSDYAKKGMDAVQQYIDQRYAMDTFRNKLHQQYDAVAQEWLKFGTAPRGVLGLGGSKVNADGRQLADLMHDTTIAGVDPTTDGKDYEKDPDKASAYRILRERFLAMPEQGRTLFVRARNSYSEQVKLLEDTLEANFTRAMEIRAAQVEREFNATIESIKDAGHSADEQARLIAVASNRYDDALRNAKKSTAGRIIALKQKFESMRVEAPYFPLKRFGRYFVAARTLAGELVSFSKFASFAEAEAFGQQLAKQDYAVRVGLDSEKDAIRGLIDPRFVADVDDIIAGKEDDLGKAFGEGERVTAGDANQQSNLMQMRDAIYQRYLETLPDMSLRKSFIHRKKVPGYDPDALRSYSSTLFHGSYQIARLKFGMEMGETLEVAEEQAKKVDPVEGMALVNELRKRHQWVMNPTGSVAGQVASSAAFVYHLGANPAHLFMNATQTAMLGVPILGSRYGFGATTKALFRAAKDFASGKGHIENALSGDERSAMDYFIDSGLIDKSQAHDLAGVGETGVEYSANRQRVMAKLSWFFHQSERFNREVTAMAAYRLARANGQEHAAAVRTAAGHTWEIHFDYSSGNRARYMQGDVAKVLFVFRNYNVNLLYRLFRDIHDAFRGDTREARKEAATQLGAMMGMYSLMAGVTGVPFYGLAVMLAGMFDDEDEPFSAEERFKQGTVDLLGEDAARFLLNGVPGTLTGVDISQRIGMPNLWFRSPERELEGRDAYFYWMEQLLGAVPAIGKNVFTGLQQIHQGNIQRGVETMLPSMVKSPVRAGRFVIEGGANNLDGEKLTDVSSGGVLAQLLGFTPAELAEQYDINSALKTGEAKLQKRRQLLLNRYAMATMQGDAERARETMAKIIDFNASNPAFAITSATVKRSLKLRGNNEERSQGGIVMSKRLQALASERAASRGQ